uniref:Dolichyl-diphosphooligosaccharide--protein glycosyltransferase subunit 2 n=1 Tax=Anthurium amnicola TaxID=1678845 RepID=A0A1D1Z7Q7_9ARAE
MAGCLRVLALLSLVCLCLSPSVGAAAVAPIDLDAHRSAALEMFLPTGGSFGSLEETYEALKTFQILGVEKGADVSQATCPLVSESLGSSSSKPRDLFNALRVNNVLGCEFDANVLEDVISKLQASVNGVTSLLDLYYTVESLVLIKEKGSTVVLADADGIFHTIKSLSQSDGRWRYNTNGDEASFYAAGLALEALAGVITLSTTEIDQSMISVVKNDIAKLFDGIESYDDGTLYFDEKKVDAREYRGPLSTTSSVVRGVAAFATVSSGKLNVPKDKIVGLAKFFLGIGIPGSSKDLFYQIDSLSCLENNRFAVPLILSLPETVLSATSKDQIKVKVTTVFGSPSPPLTVKLVRVLNSDSKDIPALEGKELKFDSESSSHSLDITSLNVDVGKYSLVFEILLHESEHANIHATGGHAQMQVVVTGFIKIDGAEIAVLDTDVESVESKKLDLSNENDVSLSANHLQKLRLSFQLKTPLGHAFKPHQVC